VAADPLRAGRRGVPVLTAIAGLGGAYLVAYAGELDGYYGGGMTRWDHAARFGSRPIVYAALGTVLTALVLAALRRPALRPAVLAVAGLACGLVLAAMIAISIGH
jgi:hypothetical protein